MITIHLEKLLFHAYHGIHPEEQLLGNQFEVNASLNLMAEERLVTLSQTVNYVTVYKTIKENMARPTPLLETLAQEMALNIHALDNRILSVNVTIKKISAPIAQFQGIVGVSYQTGS